MFNKKSIVFSMVLIVFISFSFVQSIEAKPPQKSAKSASATYNKKSTAKKQIIKKKSMKPKDLLTDIRQRWTMQNVPLDKLPRKWMVKSGKWKTTIEPEHPGNKVLRQEEVKRTHQLLLSDKKYVNFTFSSKFRADHFVTKTKNWQMGIVFKWLNTKQFYKLRISSSNIALIRYSPEELDVLPGSFGNSKVAGATGKRSKAGENVLLILPIATVSDKWHDLEVRCYGDQIAIKLNNREVRTLTDTGIGAGNIGVFTYKTQAFVDEMKLIYLPIPESVDSIKSVTNKYNRKKNPELLIYFNVKKNGPVELNILNHKKKIQAVLSKAVHAQGINSLTWNGQGLSGKLLEPGNYYIELKQDSKQALSRLTILP